MQFRFFHNQERSFITRGSLAIPVDNDPINAPADHVLNLPRNLVGIGGAVSHIHVIGATKPRHEVRINFGLRPRIQKRMDI